MVSNVTPAPEADLSDGRGAERTPCTSPLPLAPLCGELAIVVRIHTCVLVRPCCRCQRHSYRTRSTNDGVELPDGTPRGVRDLYPVWLPQVPRALPTSPRSRPPLLRAFLRAETRSSPSLSFACSLAVRGALSQLPRPRRFAKRTFVSTHPIRRETPAVRGRP